MKLASLHKWIILLIARYKQNTAWQSFGAKMNKCMLCLDGGDDGAVGRGTS